MYIMYNNYFKSMCVYVCILYVCNTISNILKNYKITILLLYSDLICL